MLHLCPGPDCAICRWVRLHPREPERVSVSHYLGVTSERFASALQKAATVVNVSASVIYSDDAPPLRARDVTPKPSTLR